MGLKIEDFEKDIIVDEVILQNKNDYEKKLLNLKYIKNLLNYYLDEVLDKLVVDIKFDTALGSILNIGKLLLNASNLNEECLFAINSPNMKEMAKFDFINEEFAKRNINLSDEIYGTEVFSVVPHYVMNSFSYIKLELLKKNKGRINECNIDMHKISRVIELFMDKYKKSVKHNEMGIRLMGEADLFSLSNLYFNLVFYIYQKSIKNIFGGRVYTLKEFFNITGIHINDLLFFINSYPQINDFNFRDLSEQLELSVPFHWFPDEMKEIQKIGKKVHSLALNIKNNDENLPTFEECLILREKVSDRIEEINFILDNRYKKYYNIGINLGGDYTFDIIADLSDMIEDDLRYICRESNILNDSNREYLYYGDDSTIETVFSGLKQTK